MTSEQQKNHNYIKHPLSKKKENNLGPFLLSLLSVKLQLLAKMVHYCYYCVFMVKLTSVKFVFLCAIFCSPEKQKIQMSMTTSIMCDTEKVLVWVEAQIEEEKNMHLQIDLC